MSLQRWNWLVDEINGRPPHRTHEDGVRDTKHPCEVFVFGAPDGHCPTDGHYVCDDCTERATCEGGCGKRPMYCECPESELLT